MFDATSRYHRAGTGSIAVVRPGSSHRTEVRYVLRRFVPRDADVLVLGVHRVVEGDRLDNLTAAYLGDPTQFWRICDANGAATAQELEVPDRLIRIPAL